MDKYSETIIKVNLDQRFLKEDAIILAKSKEDFQIGFWFYLYCLVFITIIVSLFYYSPVAGV